MSNGAWTIEDDSDIGEILLSNPNQYPRYVSMEVVELVGGYGKFLDIMAECGNNWEKFDKVVERYKKLKAFA